MQHMQHSSPDVSILHELDLGQHTLFLMSDGSVDLLINDEATPYLADNGLYLDGEEVYRLFIALREQFQSDKTGGCQSVSDQEEIAMCEASGKDWTHGS